VSSHYHEPERLLFLDTLRGLAALSVFICHALLTLGFTPQWGWLDFGQFGILTFFLISGFVIPMSVERTTPVQFWTRRFWRLYPIYWFSIVFVIALAIVGVQSESTERLNTMPPSLVLLNATMIQSFVHSGPVNLLGVYWTLALEMLFYITVTILVVLRRFSQTTVLTVGLILLAIIVERMHPWNGAEPNRPLLYIATMFVGTAFYRYTKGVMAKTTIICLIGLTILMFIAIPTTFNMLATRFFVLGFFMLMCYVRWSPRPLVYLGHISYSFYLLHQPLVEAIRMPTPLLNVIVWIVVSAVVASATYFWIEQPGMRFGKHLSRIKPAKAVDESLVRSLG
jgi:peptidoglycan/LPS O-acetylase OafA/YrhL